MRSWILTLAIFIPLAGQTPKAPLPKTQGPKLVIGIVIDQFRYDYLTKFQSEYTGGFKRIFDHGAVFTNRCV